MQRRLRITLAVTAATGAILAGAGTASADVVGDLGKGLLPGTTSESSDQGTTEEDLGDKPTKAKDGLDEDSLNSKESTGTSDDKDTSKDGKKSKDNDKSKGNSGSHGSSSSSSGGSSSNSDK
ncbi:hypothetical protein [Pseudonocardia acaciae]|uniref:hypothetical protein n=1 Tax=Pseudonocardia acaciae TaxID=551276 RepID=UPI00048FDC71|nr:hypothetical protein [Pseudonocardia acaciae]